MTDRASVLTTLAARLLRVRAPHAVRVAIDGVDGSGKTVLADELQPLIETAGRRCHRASIDDFRFPGHRDRSARGEFTPQSYLDTSYDYRALREQLLTPLGLPGTHRCLLALWDAYHDVAAERWNDIDDHAIVLVDGIFLLHDALRASWDYVIWLDTDLETALERARARDITWAPSDDEIVRRYTQRNFPAHDLYVAESNAPAVADAFIDNRDPGHPRLLRS
ncbi:MAG TPA: hypothetical protein VGQ20_09835 [Acidimicrobiales bacterium]|nr:hypothetical protein [Acidimicrobiales bacterium]